MGISISTVEEMELLPQTIIDCIPRVCECGAEIEFTDSLRQIYCSNPRCIYKIAARLESMAKAMKADGWGESTCVTVCREFNLISPFQVFQLENKGYESSVAAFDKKLASICNPEKRKVQLWEVVKLAGIPSIETIAMKIFDGYNSIEEAYIDIEKGEVPFIAQKLGLRNSEGSIMATNVYNTLLEYKDELVFGQKWFSIYKPSGVPLYIAITGGVDGFRNKSEFINYIKDRYQGKVNPIMLSTVTAQVEILVADGDTDSNKYRTALRLNAKKQEKGLSTGQFTFEQIGHFVSDKDLHPIGEQIFITNSREIFGRLDKVFGV